MLLLTPVLFLQWQIGLIVHKITYFIWVVRGILTLNRELGNQMVTPVFHWTYITAEVIFWVCLSQSAEKKIGKMYLHNHLSTCSKVFWLKYLKFVKAGMFKLKVKGLRVVIQSDRRGAVSVSKHHSWLLLLTRHLRVIQYLSQIISADTPMLWLGFY